MRITKAVLQNRLETYERLYGFTNQTGWSQVADDLPAKDTWELGLPRSVAYGAYMELHNLLDA